MLIQLYCSTLWTGPYKGVKQETQIILIKITYYILEKDFQFLCFTFLLFFKKGRSSEKENVFMFVTRMVQKGFFPETRRRRFFEGVWGFLKAFDHCEIKVSLPITKQTFEHIMRKPKLFKLFKINLWTELLYFEQLNEHYRAH